MNNEFTLRINGTRADMENAIHQLKARGFEVLDSWCAIAGYEYIIAYR